LGHETFTTDEALIATIKELYSGAIQQQQRIPTESASNDENWEKIFSILQKKPHLLQLFPRDAFSASFYQSFQAFQLAGFSTPTRLAKTGNSAMATQQPTTAPTTNSNVASTKVPESHLDLADIMMKYLNGSLQIEYASIT
jgi:hypothetical protein